ncbi:hypothetical protein WAK64_15110 [Bacillus spongiae]|uniref:Uncharacterized protein n=1 Tax=Bacillus spongiae TaxID=2683610 RepID=A0ABU8HG75_9BACI
MQPILEYRLLKAHESFESLYYYNSIEFEEILARRECEFFVKDGITYQQTSSAIEANETIIYVKKYEQSEPDRIENEKAISLEYREFNARKDHPIIKKERHSFHLDVLHKIGAVYHYIEAVEWERDSAEIDEDRMTYVLYLTPTGFELKEGEDE